MIQAQAHGSITSVVKYLGSLVHSRGSNTAEVDMRLRKAVIAWRTLGRVWYVQGVTLRVRVLLFRAVVLGCLLSGLESLVLTQWELARLERFQVGKLRTLLHGQAYRQTNEWVRMQTNTPTVTSVLTVKRVRWLRSIMQHPEQHTMLLAAVVGFPSMSPDRAPLSSRGCPT
eukprot:4549024-Heterocapsa_arctica.AAC.1